MSKRLFRKQTSVLTLRMFDLTSGKSDETVGKTRTFDTEVLKPREGLAALPSHLQIYDAGREA